MAIPPFSCKNHEIRLAALEELATKLLELTGSIATIVKDQSTASADLSGKLAAITEHLPPATGEIGEPYHR
ncbi:MAG: hypothetical protein PHH09_09110 [Methanoregulaceae archaeon]|nr:hypothetical protein [Methanoregulaceae archaeon]